MKAIFTLIISLLASCTNAGTTNETNTNKNEKEEAAAPPKPLRFAGALTNGMKGDSIFFHVSADGKKLSNLTFKGYWRCSGKLEQTLTGPEGSFTLKDGKVNDHISEPPNGGSTAWRFDLQAEIKGKAASGTFRMNINNLGCDTYKLNWTATAK